LGKTLSGVIAAIATPVHESGAPDLDRATTLARHLLDNGCDGLNVLGTTGEATSFSREERMTVMRAYKDNGLPMERLMVGTGAAAVADAVALTRHAATLGFAGALLLPPFYYKGAPDDGLAAYIEAIVKGTADKPIPLYLYHFPAMSGLRRHGLCPFGGGNFEGLRGVPVDRGMPLGGAAGSVRRLHFSDRQLQRRPLRPRLARGRPRGIGSRGNDPQTVRR